MLGRDDYIRTIPISALRRKSGKLTRDIGALNGNGDFMPVDFRQSATHVYDGLSYYRVQFQFVDVVSGLVDSAT